MQSTRERWDAARRIEGFAAAGAASRALASKLYPAHVSDLYATALVDQLGLRQLERIARAEYDPTIDDAHQWLADAAFVAARTRHFDDFALTACERGVRQVVLLGSALDTRAHRLEWPTGTVVFDVTDPPMIALKTSTMDDLGVVPRASYRPVGVDLRGAWTVALRRAGFDSEQPTAWVAEDVLGRLSVTAQNRMLTGATVLSAPGSRLAAEFREAPDLAPGRNEACVLLRRFTWELTTTGTREVLQHCGLPLDTSRTLRANQFHFVTATR